MLYFILSIGVTVQLPLLAVVLVGDVRRDPKDPNEPTDAVTAIAGITGEFSDRISGGCSPCDSNKIMVLYNCFPH